MSVGAGFPMQSSGPLYDGKVTVRYCVVLDSSVEEIKQQGADVSDLVRPKYRPKYPQGRFIVECEGTILVDGENAIPFGWFPMASFTSMPRLNGFYPPPALRYTKGLQTISERMVTQIFENAVRLNNGIVLINAASGIDLDNFGGLPAEVHVIDQAAAGQGNAVQILTPPAFGEAHLHLPNYLLELQRNLQGFTPSRSGEPTQGNVSQGLYDMSIWQSQKLTRMRGRLMAESIQRVAELAFFMMAKFYTNNKQFPIFKADAENNGANWSPIESKQMPLFDVHLDPASVRPISSTALRMMVPGLRSAGLIDTKTSLEMLEVPGADEIAQEVAIEQTRASLAGATGKKR